MSRYRVLIPDSDCTFATNVVRALGRDGRWDVSVLSRLPRPSVRFSRYCSSYTRLKTTAAEYQEHFVEVVCTHMKRQRADILLPIHEPLIRLTSQHLIKLQSEFAVSEVPELESFDVAVDKGRLAQFLAAQGLPHPPTVQGQSTDELRERCGELSFPVLLKPRRMGFGKGIIRIENFDELTTVLDRSDIRSKDVVLQQEIPGHDIDFSVLCSQGELCAWTVQRVYGSAGVNYRPPDAIEFIEDETVVELARRILRALRWSGIAHLDFRYDAARERLYLLEINARYWGSLLGSVFAGVNFPSLACRLALGQPLPEVRAAARRYGNLSAALPAPWGCQARSAEPPLPWRETVAAAIIHDPFPDLLRYLRWAYE